MLVILFICHFGHVSHFTHESHFGNLRHLHNFDHLMVLQCRSTMAQAFTDLEIYCAKLRTVENSYWLLDDDHSIALRCKGKNNAFTRKAVVVTPRPFSTHENINNNVILLKCSCAEAKGENKIISEAFTILDSDQKLNDFVKKRTDTYCIHAKVVSLPSFLIHDEICYLDFVREQAEVSLNIHEGPVAPLCSKPRLIAVHGGISWAVLGAFGSKSGLSCCAASCSSTASRCSHMERYKGRCEDEGVDPVLFGACDDEPENKTRSKKPIPFPLPIDLQTKCQDLASGKQQYPTTIRPDDDDLFGGTCPCEQRNPWVNQRRHGKAQIMSPGTVIDQIWNNGEASEIEVYVGYTDYCNCTLSPDGQSLGLINVDDKHFLTYSSLLLFLSILIHGTPTFNLFATMLFDVYFWSTCKTGVTLDKMRKIVRPGGFYSTHF